MSDIKKYKELSKRACDILLKKQIITPEVKQYVQAELNHKLGFSHIEYEYELANHSVKKKIKKGNKKGFEHTISDSELGAIVWYSPYKETNEYACIDDYTVIP